MTRILLTFLAVVILHTVATAQFKDPNAQVRNAKDFHGIRVGSAFDVYLSQGNEEAVAVSASDPNVMAAIVVEVKNGILHIGFERGFRFNGNKKLKAYISFKKIDELDISGACDARIEGSLKTDNLKLGLSGASDLKGKLEVSNKLSVNLSGASDLDVNGVAGSLDLDASGASKFKGFGLAADYCDANASGASDIKITVNKELSVKASGASDIDYKGSGVIKEIRTSGASSVSKG
jgi:hypothetical protein